MRLVLDVLWLILGYLLISGSLHAAPCEEKLELCDAVVEECEFMNQKAKEAIEYQRGLIKVQTDVINNKDLVIKVAEARIEELEDSQGGDEGLFAGMGFLGGIIFILLLPIGL